MQIIHYKLDIKACGMFNIDYSLLYSVSKKYKFFDKSEIPIVNYWLLCLQIVSSTISYLLILIQFELAAPVKWLYCMIVYFLNHYPNINIVRIWICCCNMTLIRGCASEYINTDARVVQPIFTCLSLSIFLIFW